MSSQNQFRYGAPTSMPQVLDALHGAQIVKLTRCSDSPGAVAVDDNLYRSCAIKSQDVFAYTAGPLLIELGSGVSIGADSDDSEWGSVILWVEQDADGNLQFEDPISRDPNCYPIEACDEQYSDPEACSIVGRTILSIAVFQGRKSITRPKWPCEVAMLLTMDNNDELVLCHGLRVGGSDEFSVRTKSRIPAGYFESLREVFRR